MIFHNKQSQFGNKNQKSVMEIDYKGPRETYFYLQ